MALILYSHPFAAFCQKVLIALYETGTPFEPRLVDLGDAGSRAAFYALWPIGKMPVLHDDTRGQTIPETSIIIEYLDCHYPGGALLVPADPDLAREARAADRFFDHYVAAPMQKIVGDRLRPPGAGDSAGVAQARATLRTAYAVIDRDIAGKTWATGDTFGLGDCAAAPALHYAAIVEPFDAQHVQLAGYLARLRARPSITRVFSEAKPYEHQFPGAPGDRLPAGWGTKAEGAHGAE